MGASSGRNYTSSHGQVKGYDIKRGRLRQEPPDRQAEGFYLAVRIGETAG